MLITGCIHPQILASLSLCGHGDQILIADGNYPLDSKCGDAQKIYLGLSEGIPTVPQVLEAIKSVIRVEKAEVMTPGGDETPKIFSEFHQQLPEVLFCELNRDAFYEACSKSSVRLAISTGEKRVFANILLTVGVA